MDAAGKYHASSSIGGTLKIGPLPEAPLPDPGSTPIPIPGVGLLSIGHSNSTVKAGQAYNQRIAVLIKLDASGSTVKIGRAGSMIVGKVKEGVMGGSAYGSTVTALNGVVTSGKTALLGVPCQGTNGNWLHRNTAGINVPGVAAIGATNSATMGDRGPAGAAKAVARNSVASINLGGGQLVIKGISSEARVEKSSSGKITTKATFGVLKLTDPTGTTRDLFPGQTLEIPGLGVISAGKVSKSKYKVTASAVYIELLPGTPGATIIKLGNSQASLVPTG
ncbi:choice-of-anchor P family protein [Nocardioides speluncae]|uniref:choice-of-anchor P family protein n=1 Tax=Nocardioides speluncae TaxID=2670337 RepID=UPI000D68EBB9|nr:choice-of-anchor P family protein [Nocardioides speluncae]